MTRNSGRRQVLQALAFPLGTIAVGVFFTAFAFQSERIGAEQAGDPGPVFLPATMGAVLIAGGCWLAATESRRASRRQRSQMAEAKARPWATLGLVVGMFVYLPALAWIGFSISTLVGCTLLLLSLRTRPLPSLAASCGLVIFAKLLFTQVFEVQLPEGVLENWLA